MSVNFSTIQEISGAQNDRKIIKSAEVIARSTIELCAKVSPEALAELPEPVQGIFYNFAERLGARTYQAMPGEIVTPRAENFIERPRVQRIIDGALLGFVGHTTVHGQPGSGVSSMVAYATHRAKQLGVYPVVIDVKNLPDFEADHRAWFAALAMQINPYRSGAEDEVHDISSVMRSIDALEDRPPTSDYALIVDGHNLSQGAGRIFHIVARTISHHYRPGESSLRHGKTLFFGVGKGDIGNFKASELEILAKKSDVEGCDVDAVIAETGGHPLLAHAAIKYGLFSIEYEVAAKKHVLNCARLIVANPEAVVEFDDATSTDVRRKSRVKFILPNMGICDIDENGELRWSNKLYGFRLREAVNFVLRSK